MRHLLLLGIAMSCLAVPLPSPVQAQPQTRAYAPENLRTLSYQDQVRVISLEYEEQSNGRRIPDDQLRFYTDQVNRSNWTFSQIKQDIARALAGSGYRPPQPPVPPPIATIHCDSNGNAARRCPTPWRGPSRLVRQVSNSPCIEHRSWSSEDGLVSVWNGCRAEFAAALGPVPGASIRCESTDGRGRTCRTPWQGGSRLVRQLSKAPCVEGRSWQSQPEQVYVGNGCRGEFAPRAGGYSVTCTSSGGRQPTTCAWDRNRGRPVLLETLSGSNRCIEGLTWGYGVQQGLWVSAGCRARFGTR